MADIKGIVNTKAQLKSTLNTSVKLKGVVSVGGTLIGAEMARRGLKGEKGDTGDTGLTGTGISSISKTATAGLVDTYTITLTDGNTATFDVTNGQDGTDGQDGHTPTITATKVGGTTTVYIDGTSVATIDDGTDGQDGQDGYSPTASVSKLGDTATITITDENGTTTASVSDGADGTDGTDGVSPTASVSKVGDTATITITDTNGTTTATVSDGADGAVQDVKVNGTSVLSGTVASVTVPTNTSDLNNDSGFITSESVTDVKVNNVSVMSGTVAEVTVPTKTSELNNDSGFVTSDTKVTQTNATPSSYTYWRPLVIGTSSNGTEGFTPSTSTGTTYTFNTLEVQPSSGTIRMGVASMFNGSYTTKISPTTLTANRAITLPNATGTMALTSDIPTVHNVPSGGSAGQVLSKIDGTDYNVEWANASGGGAELIYATSSDSASTVAKTATIVSGTLTTLTSGVQAIVKFAETNTASSPTLNIGSTGAKSIKRYGTTAVGQNQTESWVAGSPVLFVYDGTNWVMAGWLNTTYSGGTSAGIITGTDNLNYIWSPKQIHDGITGLSSKVQIVRWT